MTVSTLPGLGALAARAYELLDATGRPIAEERLVLHVFGLTGTRKPDFWRGQLTRVLAVLCLSDCSLTGVRLDDVTRNHAGFLAVLRHG